MKVQDVNKILKDKNKQKMETNFKLKAKKPPGGPRKPSLAKQILDKLNKFIDRQEKFNKKQEKFNKKQDARWAKQEKFNKKQEKFNKYVLDMFKKHKWIK